MIVCPNCNHQNPDGATQCEACFTPLPSMGACPNCGATVQTDARFCGQCGFDLTSQTTPAIAGDYPDLSPNYEAMSDLPDFMEMEPLVEPDPLVTSPDLLTEVESEEGLANAFGNPNFANVPTVREPYPPEPITAAQVTPAGGAKTQLQVQVAALLHIRTNTTLELPSHLSLIHIGKPNDRIPPDIDVSGFPDAEVVSRIHADIRVDGDAFYLEDTGSANGTYVNNMPLAKGNRHRLRPGDRISLGKEDKVSFLFQLN